MQEEVAKETITTKTRKGVLKRKKPIVKKQSDVVPPKDIPKEVVLKSQDEASPKIQSFVLKNAFKTKRSLQYMRKGIIIRDVLTHVSPESKNHQSLDVAQRLKKRKLDTTEASYEKVTVETEDESETDKSSKRIVDSFYISL